jgi:hypothetical protein
MNKIIVQELLLSKDSPSIMGFTGGKTNYRYDCTNIKLIKPENKKPAEAQAWAKKNMYGKFRMYEQGIMDNDNLIISHYFVFDKPEDAMQFKLIWGVLDE